jgi:hypothetical protein
MVIPRIGVSLVSDSTVLPTKAVLAVWTVRFTEADCADAIPSTVAEAVMVSDELPAACPAETFTVSRENWPAVMCAGERLAVTPLGSPDTLRVANWLKPLLLFRLREYVVLVPCSTLADEGLALRVKLEEAVTFNVAAETPDRFPEVTVTGPEAAPAGITKVILVAVKLTMGAGMLPLPCWLRVTWGVAAPFAVKLLPAKVTTVPTGADVGLNEEITTF